MRRCGIICGVAARCSLCGCVRESSLSCFTFRAHFIWDNFITRYLGGLLKNNDEKTGK